MAPVIEKTFIIDFHQINYEIPEKEIRLNIYLNWVKKLVLKKRCLLLIEKHYIYCNARSSSLISSWS